MILPQALRKSPKTISTLGKMFANGKSIFQRSLFCFSSNPARFSSPNAFEDFNTESISMKQDKKEWEFFADKYVEGLEAYTIPTNMGLYSMVEAHKSEKILETGVGGGKASLMFTSTMMKDGASYVGTDICENLTKHLKSNYQESGFAMNQNNHLEVL